MPLAAPLFDAYRIFYVRTSDRLLARRFLSERLERGESVLLLALDGEPDRAVGISQLYPIFSSVTARPRWLLNDLFVVPEARGRGVGRALLEPARRLAVETGAAALVLATAPDNVSARRLYDSMRRQRDELLLYSLNL